MTIAHKARVRRTEKPVGSFYVNGSTKEPSIHEVVWYPEFEDDFRPTSSKSARRVYGLAKTNAGRPRTISYISTTALSSPMFRMKPFS